MSAMPREEGMPAVRICAVAVIWHPDLPLLSSAIAAIAPQVVKLLLIANDGVHPPLALPENAVVMVPDENLGLGGAYNRAADWARTQGATHLLLLDQDSVAEPRLVAALATAFDQPGPVAAAGALWRDRRTGQEGFFVRLTRWGARKFSPKDPGPVPVDFLISSGSLISLDAMNRIGGFDEALFVEHVDTDWCLRARAMGYGLYGVARARLDHAFGDATLTPAALGGSRSLFLYPPERNYYLLRNSIILWRRPYAPKRWVLHDIRRTFLLMLYYGLFVPPRLERLKYMRRAVRDALRRKSRAD